MIHLIKFFPGEGHASKIVCEKHAGQFLDDMDYDPVLEGPWEVDETEKPNLTGFRYKCEVEGCDAEE